MESYKHDLLPRALGELSPDPGSFVIQGRPYDYYMTKFTGDPIPLDDVKSKIAELEQLKVDTQYQKDRVTGTEAQPLKYASSGDQKDMQYWDAINGTTNWIEHITEVKEAHKKPT